MSELRQVAQQALEALQNCANGEDDVLLTRDALAALRAALAEPEGGGNLPPPLQEPVAWIHTDPDKPRVKFLEWRENEPGYRGRWIKTPLYTAPHGITP